MKFWKGDKITKLEPNYIFVFGSNPEGRHGAGAAKHALKFGAKYGIGRGLQGQTYALPTKNLKEGFIEKLPDGSTITYDKAGCKSLSKEASRKYEEVLAIENTVDCLKDSLTCDHEFTYAEDHVVISGYIFKEYWCEKCGIYTYDKDSKEKSTL